MYILSLLYRPLFAFCIICVAFLDAVPATSKGFEVQPIALDLKSETKFENKLILTTVVSTLDIAPVLRTQNSSAPGIMQASLELPQPSVILGFIAPGQETLFGLSRLLPATVEKFKFALDDLSAREALRNSDIDLFKRLIQEGHLDPDPSQLNFFLQTEFKRMRCYLSSIDGSWGPGSRRSVRAYFEQLNNNTWEDQSPTVALFRSVLINGDVDCPIAKKAKRQKPSVTEKPKTNKPIISLGVGTGAFR